MINTYLFSKSGLKRDVPLDEWQPLAEDECSLLWVDVRALTKADVDLLSQQFNVHGIAAESCLDRYRRPHLYEFSDHFYVNMTMIRSTRSDHGIKPLELHLFVGTKYIITATGERECEAVDKALQEYISSPEMCERGPMHAVYLLTEDLVETYYPVIEKLDDDADKLEDMMLDRADKALLKRNFDLKRRDFEVRRLLGPQRDVLNDLSRRDFPFIEGESQVYFQDVYNRMIRLFDMLDTIREILSGNLDIYLSIVSNRLSEVMKVLTVFATILMLLSLITGFYGMNFTRMPWLHSPNAFRNILVAMGLITGGMLLWFRHKRYL